MLNMLILRYEQENIMQYNVQAIILAAGASRRFHAPYTKLIAPLCGTPIIRHLVDTLRHANIPITLVLGHDAEQVRRVLPDDDMIQHTYQDEQLGTGHAVMCGYNACSADNILVMNGDTPLVTCDTIQSLCDTHARQNAHITFVTADNCPHAHGYGKVVQTDDTIEIVEAGHAAYDMSAYQHINAGIYMFNRTFLDHAIDQLTPHDRNNEIYITDVIGYASTHGYHVATVHAPFDTIRGINTVQELQHAEQCYHQRIMQHLYAAGVYVRDPNNTYIDSGASIGTHTRIEPGAYVSGTSTIGKRCHIGAHTIIHNSSIADDVCIEPHSYTVESTIDSHAHIGPFAHVRKRTHIKSSSVIGTFVEAADSVIGPHAKAKHISYIGNTTVDTYANIGAGTVICNFDGYHKHNTHIQQHAFIGSNTTCIAPVTIGAQSIVAAGSVITRDVPDDALAIARKRETIKEGYAQHIRDKLQQTHAQTRTHTQPHNTEYHV